MAKLDREILGDYVDGHLDDEARVAVAALLADSPEDMAVVEQYRVQDRAIQEALEPILYEPVPEKLSNTVRRVSSSQGKEQAKRHWRWQSWQAIASAAAVVVLIVGAGAGGWMARGQQEAERLNALLIQQFIRSAADSYILYDRDTDRRQDVKTRRMKTFVAWLYESFGDDFTPPGLEAKGFEFAGGRLLPSVSGPAAQMTYTDTDSRRVTLYFVKEKSQGPIEAAANLIAQTVNGIETFFVRDDKRSIYLWDQAPLKYALVAEMERKDLSILTESVLSRLSSKPENSRR